MARLSVADIFDQARDYLDTDELNLPDALLDQMLQRVWFEAVNMEVDWRFLTHTMNVAVLADQRTMPMSFLPVGALPGVVPTPAVRVDAVRVTNGPVMEWVPYHEATIRSAETGSPCWWSEYTEGPQRLLALFPAPYGDMELTISFYAAPVYPPPTTPVPYLGTFADLPEEFDQALKVGLLAEAYLREEDPELYDVQREVYLQAMGSIRQRWRKSDTEPLVMNKSPMGRSDDRMAVGRLPSGF